MQLILCVNEYIYLITRVSGVQYRELLHDSVGVVFHELQASEIAAHECNNRDMHANECNQMFIILTRAASCNG